LEYEPQAKFKKSVQNLHKRPKRSKKRGKKKKETWIYKADYLWMRVRSAYDPILIPVSHENPRESDDDDQRTQEISEKTCDFRHFEVLDVSRRSNGTFGFTIKTIMSGRSVRSNGG